MNEVRVVPLGGCGSFGLNATLICGGDQAVLIDFGVGFSGDSYESGLRLVPDPGPWAERFPRLAAIVLTHAHDDHIGALPFLPPAWLAAPIYGLPFTLGMAKQRLADLNKSAPDLRRISLGRTEQAGGFELEFARLTHSIPDSLAVAIRTTAGWIVHSGDFKLDPEPVVGATSDLDRLRAWGERGVRLLLLDSTGALRPGSSGSESSVAAGLREQIVRASGQVFVSTFATHLHRIQLVLRGAAAAGRQVTLLGMRASRSVKLGLEQQLLDVPAGLLISPDEARTLPRQQRLYFASGCQAEPDSSLGRLASGIETRAEVAYQDTVVISASIVPGNDQPVTRLINRLLRRGANVIHARYQPGLHVSGHASIDELRQLCAWLRPKSVLPVHGDRQHLLGCQQLIAAAFPETSSAVVELGDSLLVTHQGVAFSTSLPLEPRVVDEHGVIYARSALPMRRRLARTGALFVSAAVDGPELVALRVHPAGISLELDRARSTELEALIVSVWRQYRFVRLREWIEAELTARITSWARAGARQRPEVIVHLVVCQSQPKRPEEEC